MEGQLSQESGRVNGGLGGRLEADFFLHEVELVTDEVVELILVAHAVVQNPQGLKGGCVFTHRACHVPHLLIVCNKDQEEVVVTAIQ